MSGLQIGASCEKDIPALKALWERTFGDPDALVDAFFTLLPRVGAGLVCRDGGTPVAMAYLLGGLSAGGRKCAYIYAVATDERCRGRGIGDALMKACAELAGRWGCDTLCTSPAEPSLYDWYAKTLAMEVQKMALGEPDEKGRRKPVAVPGSNWVIDCDAVIIAIGTSPNPLIRSTTKGLDVTPKGGIQADENGQTSREGVFAGGDAVTGAATVILAMAQDVLIHQRPTEIALLNGKIVEYGQKYGVPTPANSLLTRLVSCMQANYAETYRAVK